MKRLFLSSCFFWLVASLHSQSPDILQIRKYRASHQQEIMNEFFPFLSIPNIASDTLNIRRNADFIMEMMQKRDIRQVQLLLPVTPGAPPVVYGEVIVNNTFPTLIFYAHYDGQPVNPAQWAPGLEPFVPKLATGSIAEGGDIFPFKTAESSYNPGWRIYARGSSDDKAGVVAILNAYEAIVKSGLKPSYNIKFFFEGEEEAGSPHLNEILEKYSSLLQSDLWIICDGPVHQSGKKQVVFGVRGDARLDLTVYASKRPLHSGHYGNWAPSPAMMLVKLLSSMKDDQGKVTIKGFYDDVVPLTAAEKKALKEMPPVDEQMKKELGIRMNEMPGKTLGESINLPSLNINGMQSGNV
ncbi:MAG TPA: M20/M25/M40 family metallo-hydrolase, partial [Chitinophagaceae bacterium]|nr:M20/M25/M40 family metallo-hydrolase [Chitinophagaceae bacterium]